MVFAPPAGHRYFHPGNVGIHGIRPSDVADGPYFEEIYPLMMEFIGEDVLVAHNAPFDMGVLRASLDQVGAEIPELLYACSVQVSRKAWPGLDSHRLNAVAYRIGIEEFNHHDALADSEVCAQIIIEAAKHFGVEAIDDLATEAKIKIKPLVVT
jgi:DNA polymerase-3 subunit epsilon